MNTEELMGSIKLFKDTVLFLRTKKRYYLPGTIIFILLFVISTILNFDFTYMGNKSDKLMSIVLEHYLSVVITQILKILIFYSITGIILNIAFYTAIKEIQKRFDIFKKKENFHINLFTCVGIFLCVFIVFSEKIIRNPQLYIENFASHSYLLKKYLSFLTDHINPVIFDIILSSVFIILAFFIIISIDWMKIIKILFRFKGIKLKYNVLIFLVPITLACIIYSLYKNNLIFYNTTNSKPNILIISSDALRPDHFSFNGYKKRTTPNIDRISNGALQVRGTFTTLPRTFPAWVSILTSKYPMTHGINHMFPRTRERNLGFNSCVGYLNDKGYLTSVISDFAGDIFPRIDLGFKKVRAPEMDTNVLIKQMLLEKQTFLLPFITNSTGLFFFPEMRDFSKMSFPDILTEETVREIDSSRGDPFFIVSFYSITHFPFCAPYPYYKMFSKPGYEGQHKYFKDRILRLDETEKNTASLLPDVDSADKEQVNALYDGCLNLFDNEVGKIIEHLEYNGILKNTIVVITSDHGENLYEKDFGMGHGEHLKGNYSLEVPFMIYYHELKNKGYTIKAASSVIDIVPTVFDIAGMKTPENFDGISVLKKNSDDNYDIKAYCETGMWFDNDKSSPLFFHHQRIDYPDITGVSEIDFSYKDEVVISQRYQNVVIGAKYRTVYSQRYKLIYMPLSGGPKFELYDHISDPDNNNDLSGIKTDVLNTMKRNFYEFMNEKSAGNFIIKNGMIFPVFANPIF